MKKTFQKQHIPVALYKLLENSTVNKIYPHLDNDIARKDTTIKIICNLDNAYETNCKNMNELLIKTKEKEKHSMNIR